MGGLERRTGERMDTKDGGGDGYEGERVERVEGRMGRDGGGRMKGGKRKGGTKEKAESSIIHES